MSAESSPWVDAIGPLSQAEAARFGEQTLFSDDGANRPLGKLFDTLREMRWDDAQAAELLRFVAELTQKESALERAVDLVRRALKPTAVSVIECLRTVPPANYEIHALLSEAGKHKLVFLARAKSKTANVVLKKLKDDADFAGLQRDLVQRTDHPHIIATDVIQNAQDDFFLVEQPLDVVVDYDYQISGSEEAANMLHELALGLHELHDTSRLAHNDIKPGNIGILNEYFTLIDLGNCTYLESQFDEGQYGRGSLHTRAPELILGGEHCDRRQTDVWSLGAVVFYYLSGRFPLFEEGELIEDVGPERDAQICELQRRIDQEWDTRLTLETPSDVGRLVLQMLARQADERLSSEQVPREARKVLGSRLRATQVYRMLRPSDEVAEILANLPSERDAISVFSRRRLVARLRELEELSGWNTSTQSRIRAARQALSE